MKAMRLFSAPIVDIMGNPSSNGIIYVYREDKTITTYSNATCEIPNPSPVFLDSTGYAEIWAKDWPCDIYIYDYFNNPQSIIRNVKPFIA